MPDVPEHATAVKRLQEARQLLRDNQVDAALGAARKALEPVLEAARDGGLSKGAQAKAARDGCGYTWRARRPAGTRPDAKCRTPAIRSAIDQTLLIWQLRKEQAWPR